MLKSATRKGGPAQPVRSSFRQKRKPDFSKV
jgi:hypothetical protein